MPFRTWGVGILMRPTVAVTVWFLKIIVLMQLFGRNLANRDNRFDNISLGLSGLELNAICLRGVRTGDDSTGVNAHPHGCIIALPPLKLPNVLYRFKHVEASLCWPKPQISGLLMVEEHLLDG